MKISVIVPVYNSEKYLNDLFTSLLNQKLEDIEIIAIDDNSSDKSLDILKSYRDKFYPKIRVYKNETNLGVGASRNRGLIYAKGEYVSFVDSDDFIHPLMYYDMYHGRDNHKIDIITTGIVFVKEEASFQDYYRNRRGKGFLLDTRKDENQIIYESPSCANKLFRKEFIGEAKFLVDTMWEDVAFSYAHMFLTDHILVFHNPDYYYRKQSKTGVSAQGLRFNPKLRDIFKVADELKRITLNADRYDYFKKQIKLIQVVSV